MDLSYFLKLISKNIPGTGKTCMGKGYVFLKIKKEDHRLYSSSGSKGICHYKDKDGSEGWSKMKCFGNI